MLCELVQTQTPDLVRLDGALFRATVEAPKDVDAALILPGLAGNFYSSRLMHSVGRQLLERGINVLQANTRGHDAINWLSIGGRTEANGAAFERVDDCRHDIAGWITFLIGRGFSRVAIVGHSLGAIKALYSEAHQPNPAVRYIVALSTSRLNYDRFLQSPHSARFQSWFTLAQSHVDSGDGRALMRVDFPFPAFIAAEAYLEKYGPANRFDWTTFVDRIDIPILLVFGERELAANAAFSGILEDVERLQGNCPRLQSKVVPDADHFYVGRRQVVSRLIGDWLTKPSAD